MIPGLRVTLSVLTAVVLLLGSGMVVPLNLCLCPSAGLAVESALDLCCEPDGVGEGVCHETLGEAPADCGDCTDIPLQVTWARGGSTPTGKDLTPSAVAPVVKIDPFTSAEVSRDASCVGADPPYLSPPRLIVLRC